MKKTEKEPINICSFFIFASASVSTDFLIQFSFSARAEKENSLGKKY